ncbi:carbohydrate ABC transporter permease [Neobacillus cucumis]|nr:carbohydrate ABC transporter permease [Neobacillus cucumis]
MHKTSRLVHFLFIIACFACILPFILLFMSSVTDEASLLEEGYKFIPHKFSGEAYSYLLSHFNSIGRAYGVTALVTVIGTTLGLTITSLLAYPLSRKDLPFRNLLGFFVFFTMLFNGGLVPTYLVYTKLIDIKDTIWALIIPNLLMNAFYVFLVRTFFETTIPFSLVESAYMDGASEFKIFRKIILPLSTPVLATVGLFQSLHYWNDWFNSLIYINNQDLYNIQFLLNKILLDIQFISSNNLGSSAASSATSNIPLETVQMAMAFVGVLPIMIAYPFFQKYFVKGLTIGAVK